MQALYEWAESKRLSVRALRVGALELHLEPLRPSPSPHVAPESVPSAAETERAEERRFLETLLHSSGADITPFLRRA